MKKQNFILKISFIGIFAAAVLMTSCSKDDPALEPDPPVVVDPPVVTPTFNGPTYADNYTAISGWASRSQWNLANVHDPSVEKSGDYYYMYQTDASYGNAHDGHGHFPYRRSKDLITWEFMGTAMAQAPAWVKDSLNNKFKQLTTKYLDIINYEVNKFKEKEQRSTRLHQHS